MLLIIAGIENLVQLRYGKEMLIIGLSIKKFQKAESMPILELSLILLMEFFCDITLLISFIEEGIGVQSEKSKTDS